MGRNAIVRCFDMWVNGKVNRTRIEASRATVPPSLFGIDRRIVYTNKKYHSGLICDGVTRAVACRKFSGSANRLGAISVIVISAIIAIKTPRMSL